MGFLGVTFGVEQSSFISGYFTSHPGLTLAGDISPIATISSRSLTECALSCLTHPDCLSGFWTLNTVEENCFLYDDLLNTTFFDNNQANVYFAQMKGKDVFYYWELFFELVLIPE